MRSYYRRVFPDVSRIRTITDAYRDAYVYKGGLLDSLMVAAADDGMTCLVHGPLCQSVPSSVSLNGSIWYAFSGSGALYVYTFRYAPLIVRFVDTSPKTRSQNRHLYFPISPVIRCYAWPAARLQFVSHRNRTYPWGWVCFALGLVGYGSYTGPLTTAESIKSSRTDSKEPFGRTCHTPSPVEAQRVLWGGMRPGAENSGIREGM